jgi:hypothetical protein
MLGFWRKSSAFCGATAKKRFRTPDRVNGFVCRACFERWNGDGRRCVACGSPVNGTQEVGAFYDQRSLGHADCGGLKLLP